MRECRVSSSPRFRKKKKTQWKTRQKKKYLSLPKCGPNLIFSCEPHKLHNHHPSLLPLPKGNTIYPKEEEEEEEEEGELEIMAYSLSNFHCHSSSSILSIKPKTPSSSSSSFFPQFRTSSSSSPSFKSQFFGVQLLSSTVSFPSTSSSFKNSTIYAKVSKGGVPPPFTLKDQDGRNVSLSKFKGKPVVLYFYPADETPGCTKQACAFRDSYEKFKKAGAEVVGISGDNSASHKAFAKKYKLPYTLLSDEGNKIRKEWGVPSDLFGTLPGRQTYVLDKNGVVQLIYNNQFQPEKHIDETLKLLQSL